ncbi:polysaccharide biosynthesis tyrosine autokinase [Actinomycetospora termitidis]|uniref:Polysaccharide biosynthesis tyrosine autokinase n=1 Tax=Actinomycetospora termitidis TaxID=3053470 RepID=A0ABT7ME72_9PSEU|nr:polysaccharide biosynthesis tyrosine autokinase [Actinomycetospora sp. Odt1-22]MDL5158964.1 polysaccharide biosynthesis tyrosine autokinase [Actinomycetospora sp. Odt1-22]
MTIDDFLRIVRDRWVAVVAGLLVGALAGLAFGLLSPSYYTATTTLYVYSPSGDSTDAAYQGSLVSQQRVSSYAELVTSEEVTDDVIAKLGLTETSPELAKQLSASSSSESVLIDLSATDGDSQRAALLANTVATSFIAVVNDLEKPSAPGAQQQVFVRQVRPARAPVEAGNPSVVVTTAVGGVLGLALGVVAAVLISALDKSVRSVGQLRRVSGVPTLGAVPMDPTALEGSVADSLASGSAYSEALRSLRTNLDFVDVDHDSSLLVVTSPFEGEGKTTTVVGLAVALASAGKRVIIVDADLRRPQLASRLGFDESVGLSSVLAGKVPLDHALQPWGPGLTQVLASGVVPPNPSELLASRQAVELFRALRERADVVLVDTPPVLPVTDAATVARHADATLLLCRIGRTRIAQVESALTSLRSVSANVVGTVATMVPTTGDSSYVGRSAYHKGTATTSVAAPQPMPTRSPQQNGAPHQNGAPQNGRALPAFPQTGPQPAPPGPRPSPGPRATPAPRPRQQAPSVPAGMDPDVDDPTPTVTVVPVQPRAGGEASTTSSSTSTDTVEVSRDDRATVVHTRPEPDASSDEADSRAVDTKATDTKAVDTKAVDTKAVDTKAQAETADPEAEDEESADPQEGQDDTEVRAGTAGDETHKSDETDKSDEDDETDAESDLDAPTRTLTTEKAST